MKYGIFFPLNKAVCSSCSKEATHLHILSGLFGRLDIRPICSKCMRKEDIEEKKSYIRWRYDLQEKRLKNGK